MQNSNNAFVVRRCQLHDIASLSRLLKVCWHATYDRMLKQFGLDATTEIFSIAGLYSMVSTVLNGFDVPPRIGGETPF